MLRVALDHKNKRVDITYQDESLRENHPDYSKFYRDPNGWTIISSGMRVAVDMKAKALWILGSLSDEVEHGYISYCPKNELIAESQFNELREAVKNCVNGEWDRIRLR